MKKAIYFILAIFMCITIIGCVKQEDPVEKDLEMIKSGINMFEDKLEEFDVDMEMIDGVIEQVEDYNKETKYVIAFNIKDKNNSMMNMTLHFPVEKEFFDSVEVGDTISEDVMDDFEDLYQYVDNFVITVENKIVRE